MGRYYNGDIRGKFWFALQPSDAASRFGGEELEPNYITYYFQEEDLEGVEVEIQRIEKTLGDNKKVIDNFFIEKESYSRGDLEKIGITEEILREYADLDLGIKIRDCIKENGDCTFDAEL